MKSKVTDRRETDQSLEHLACRTFRLVCALDFCPSRWQQVLVTVLFEFAYVAEACLWCPADLEKNQRDYLLFFLMQDPESKVSKVQGSTGDQSTCISR